MLGTVQLEKTGRRFRPELNDTSPNDSPNAATHTAPMLESIEPRDAEVKKEAFMEAIKVIEVNDLWSKFWGRKGGAAGGGAGRSWALG